MTLFTHAWEHSLLSMAYEGQHASSESYSTYNADDHRLQQAYTYCENLTAHHSRSFYLASRLLSPEKRRAVRALYAFCRVTDDIVDSDEDNIEARLSQWRHHALTAHPPADDLVAQAWADARLRHGIPIHYARQLLNGVARDLFQVRYDTFDELAAYAYGVASTVGLMSMHITGFDGPEAIPYAIKLGVALQVTNILRDVGEDWRRGRIYLPLQELHTFGLSEGDIADGRVTDRWREFMRFQIIRNRQLYAEAWPGISMLSSDGRFAIGAAADLYRGILDAIEANDYDVFSRRAYVGKWGKLRRLPAIWWRTRSFTLSEPTTLPKKISPTS